MVSALAKEMVLEKQYFSGEPIQTIYFGGGTPSLLSVEECQFLLESLHTHFDVQPNAEITLEANPDDITAEKLQGWKAAGINRLSIGVQSFFEDELRWMNRAHNSNEALSALQMAVDVFDNITMDLIYGSPLLTDEMWKHNVDVATSLGVKHLSCYALTVEEKTPLYKSIQLRQKEQTDNEQQARQFLLLMQWLKEKGYEHYEVSNFAQPGFRSRHNSSYWKGAKYLGLGPSAHSYNGVQRRWNLANNQQYIKGVETGEPYRDAETLTPEQRLNEYIMISLRTSEGLNMQRVETEFGEKQAKRIEQLIQPFMTAGLVKSNANSVQLTDEGMLKADGIASDLFIV